MLATDSDTPLVPCILAARRNAARDARAAAREQRRGAPPAPAVSASRARLVALARVPDPRARAGSRETPCLGCVRSALKGMSTGECFDTAGRGARCLRCSHGHKCEPVPEHLQLLARRLVGALVNRASKGKISNLRSAMRVMLELEEEEEEEEEEEDEE